MRILITNDDGVTSAGIRALIEALQGVGELRVVAPDRQQSAAGHAITLHKPLRMNPVKLPGLDVEAYASNGTPADCVILGVLTAEQPPDLVVSGINSGANLGEEILYSGTVSAAMEGSLHGLPSLAVSVCEYDGPVFEAAAQFTRRLVETPEALAMCRGCFLNVNVPSVSPDQIGGVVATRLGRRAYINAVSRREDPRGRPYYWFSGEPQELDSGADTDIGAIGVGKISVTPVHHDLTDRDGMARLSRLLATLKI